MNTVLSELHQDHVVLARALRGLRRQFGVIEQGGALDVHRVSDLIDYIQSYPDLDHHPREDFVASICLERSDKAVSLIERLQFQHRILAEQSEDVLNLLEQCENDLPVPRSRLARCLRQYLRTQLQHFHLEEDSLYALAYGVLTPDDWQRVVATVPHRHLTSLESTLQRRCECSLRRFS